MVTTRRYATTAERGYGTPHQALRAQLLARWRPGDPCARCGRPMWGPASKIDLGHDHVRGGYAGLEHSACNRRDGAVRQNRARGVIVTMAPQAPPATCKTCGKSYHRAARNCCICDRHYHPSRSIQYTCSRPCGAEYKRRTYGHVGPRPPAPRPPCVQCGKPCVTGKKFCSKPCADEALRKVWPSSRIQSYVCRYCGKPGVARGTGQPREVCPERICQLARLRANNLRVRYGLTTDEADARMAKLVRVALENTQRKQQGRRRPPSLPVTTLNAALRRVTSTTAS